MEELSDILKTITTEMQKSLSPQTAVGEPITVEGRTIIPLMSVGMGFGAGSGKGKESEPGGAGGGHRIDRLRGSGLPHRGRMELADRIPVRMGSI